MHDTICQLGHALYIFYTETTSEKKKIQQLNIFSHNFSAKQT